MQWGRADGLRKRVSSRVISAFDIDFIIQKEFDIGGVEFVQSMMKSIATFPID